MRRSTHILLLAALLLLAGCAPTSQPGGLPAASPSAATAAGQPTAGGDAPSATPAGTVQPSQTLVDPAAAPSDASTASPKATAAVRPTATAKPGGGAAVQNSPSAAVQRPATQAPTSRPAPTPRPAAQPTPQPTSPPTQPPKQSLTVTVAIDCKTAVEAGYDLASQVSSGGVILSSTTVRLEAGATVYDALKAAAGSRGIPVSKVGSGSRVYVASINSLAEGDCGGESGWMYSVNGVYPGKGCGSYPLADGDTVRWRYTTNLGVDLGSPVG